METLSPFGLQHLPQYAFHEYVNFPGSSSPITPDLYLNQLYMVHKIGFICDGNFITEGDLIAFVPRFVGKVNFLLRTMTSTCK